MSLDQPIEARDDQVFLIMGVNEHDDDAQCAIVLAQDIEKARAAFSRTYQGSVPMTWPSLAEIKMSVAMLELARNGGYPEDVAVINQIE